MKSSLFFCFVTIVRDFFDPNDRKKPHNGFAKAHKRFKQPGHRNGKRSRF